MARAKPGKIQLYADLMGQTSLSQLYWRGRRIAWEKVGSKLSKTFSKPVTDERTLFSALRKNTGEFSDASALAAHFKNKQFRVWPLSEGWLRDTGQLTSQRFPRVAEKICSQAEESLGHTFEFEGSGKIDFGQQIDWDPDTLGFHEQVYALNRLYHLPNVGRAYLLTGDLRYLREIETITGHWLAANNKPVGRPWNVLTTALRLNAWIEAYGCIRTSGDVSDEAHVNMAKAVVSHAGFLARHIEYDILNNHLVFEGRTLLAAGITFPEFRQADKWRDLGMELLDSELQHEVRPDGCHAEQSAAYHLQVMWEYLCAIALLESCGKQPPDVWQDSLSKMADFLLDILRPDGTVPMTGDSALHDPQTPYPADVLAAASVFLQRPELQQRKDDLTERGIWLLGPRSTDALAGDSTGNRRDSAFYRDGGYCILRGADAGADCYAIFDCGPFGLEDSPAHGHADALSFEFSAFGKNLIVDPGVYTYEAGPWRGFFRGTSAHNTVAIDGRDQACLWGAFRVYKPRAAVLNVWQTGPGRTVADASYQWTESGATHRRLIGLVDGRFLVVFDCLSGEGEHDVVVRFHFSPSNARLASDDDAALLCTSVQGADDNNAVGVAILGERSSGDTINLASGSEGPIQGWVSYEKGKKEPAPVLEWRRRAVVPTSFVSIAYPFLGTQPPEDLQLNVVETPPDGYGVSASLTVATTRYEMRVSENGLEVDPLLSAS